MSFGNDFNFAKLFIRGIGLNSSFPGADPSVALHLDGAVIAQAGAQMSSMFDLEQVEVLRGPQGTLYGRNATGGVINLISAKPTETVEGYARVTAGGPDLPFLGEAAIGGPISEKVRARLAVRYLNRDGYAINELTGEEIDNARQIRPPYDAILPSDSFELMLSGEFHSEDDASNALKFREAAFPNATAPAPGQVDLRSLATQPGFSVASDPRNIRANVEPINDRKTSAATLTATWRLTDVMSLKSITNQRDYEAEFYQDFDVSDYPGCRQPLVGPASTCTLAPGTTRTAGNHWQPLYQHQFSEELQFNFDTERLHGLLAGYYLKEYIRIENHLGFNPNPHFSSDPADARAIFDGAMNVMTWAVFANATYDFTDKFSLKGGARYSYEERDVASYQATAIPPAAAPAPSALGYPWVRAADWSNFSPSLGVEFRPNRRAHDLPDLCRRVQERHIGHRRSRQGVRRSGKSGQHRAGLEVAAARQPAAAQCRRLLSRGGGCAVPVHLPAGRATELHHRDAQCGADRGEGRRVRSSGAPRRASPSMRRSPGSIRSLRSSSRQSSRCGQL